ncbi:MAG: restriction endonuclease subunit S [Firmicutes bacterium]|nr:restriction endonuclease subunit S [Bacillota bacterium]
MSRVKLGEICQIVSGSTPKTSVNDYWDGDIDWITPAELTNDSYILNESARKITELGVQKTGLKPFPKGTVILSSRAPIGKVAIAGKEMYCNQGFKNLICSDAILPEYLYWFLKGNTEYLNSLGRGATFKEISKKIVSDIEINVPGIVDQKNAVDILERCWTIIKERRKELEKLDELIKARFVEMSSRWNCDEKLLSEYLEMITYGFTNPMPDAEDGPWKITAKDVVDGRVNFSKARKTTQESFDSLTDKSKPITGDVLLTKDGTLGRTAVVEDDNICVNQSVAVLRCNRKVIPQFLSMLLQLPEYQREMTKNSGGGTIKHIYITRVNKMVVKIPTIEQQNEFIRFWAQVDKSKVAIQKSLDETQLLFDSLMQKYFG